MIDLQSPIVVTIIGGVIVGILLLIIEHKTGLFINNQKYMRNEIEENLSFKEIKQKSLQNRLSQLLKEYESLSKQLSTELNEAAKLRLQGQLNQRTSEINELEAELLINAQVCNKS